MNSILRLKTKSRAQRGFTMVELTVVVLIVLVVAAISIPGMIQAWYNMELRATGDQVAGLMQQARILAAKNNAYYTVCYQTNGGVQQVYLTQVSLYSTAACTYVTPSSSSQGSYTVDLARLITAASAAPTGSNPSPYVLTGDTSSGTPCDNKCTLAFSPRGLPCVFTVGTPGTCPTPATSYFVYYFQAASSQGWAAVAVTKAGRSRTFTWNGSAWN